MFPNLQIPNWDTPQSNGVAGGGEGTPSPLAEDYDAPFHHVFSTDHFRMFQFKVRNCPRGRSHDWTECPYAHPAEKARRRDPRKFHYSGASCPEFRKGHCPKGDACEFAHGVFECWLHPSRYRTQLCKDGTNCRRRVCFFAHAPDQLRVLAPPDSPTRHSASSSLIDSPTSVLSTTNYSTMCESPPSSPYGVVSFDAMGGVRELVGSMRGVQIDEVGPGAARIGSLFGSPRGQRVRPGLMRMCYEEEPPMARVESGRDIRARMYAKLSRDNSCISAPTPDIGWVSELVN